MSRRFAYLMIALMLLALLSACKSDKAVDKADAAGTASSSNNGVVKPAETYPNTNGTPVLNNGPVLHNAVAGDDVKLPSDIPVFKGAKEVGKRITNRMMSNYRAISRYSKAPKRLVNGSPIA
jgi:hypothetical protein